MAQACSCQPFPAHRYDPIPLPALIPVGAIAAGGLWGAVSHSSSHSSPPVELAMQQPASMTRSVASSYSRARLPTSASHASTSRAGRAPPSRHPNPALRVATGAMPCAATPRMPCRALPRPAPPRPAPPRNDTTRHDTTRHATPRHALPSALDAIPTRPVQIAFDPTQTHPIFSRQVRCRASICGTAARLDYFERTGSLVRRARVQDQLVHTPHHAI